MSSSEIQAKVAHWPWNSTWVMAFSAATSYSSKSLRSQTSSESVYRRLCYNKCFVQRCYPLSSGCTAWRHLVAKSRNSAKPMTLWEALGPYCTQSLPDVALRRPPGLSGFLEKTPILHNNNDLCSQWNLLSVLFIFMMCTPSAYPIGMDSSTWWSKLLPLRWVLLQGISQYSSASFVMQDGLHALWTFSCKMW